MTQPVCCRRLTDFGLARMLDLNKSHVSTKSFGATCCGPPADKLIGLHALDHMHKCSMICRPQHDPVCPLCSPTWMMPCRYRHHPLHAARAPVSWQNVPQSRRECASRPFSVSVQLIATAGCVHDHRLRCTILAPCCVHRCSALASSPGRSSRARARTVAWRPCRCVARHRSLKATCRHAAPETMLSAVFGRGELPQGRGCDTHEPRRCSSMWWRVGCGPMFPSTVRSATGRWWRSAGHRTLTTGALGLCAAEPYCTTPCNRLLLSS